MCIIYYLFERYLHIECTEVRVLVRVINYTSVVYKHGDYIQPT